MQFYTRAGHASRSKEWLDFPWHHLNSTRRGEQRREGEGGGPEAGDNE